MAKNTCCCSKCGVPPTQDAITCCSCVCDIICVEVTDMADAGTAEPDACPCAHSVTQIPWNKTECAYIGTLVCGNLRIDARFDVAKDEQGNCCLLLTSECLGVSDCKPFSPGNINGDCGHYIKDCDQQGGWDLYWNVNANSCAYARPAPPPGFEYCDAGGTGTSEYDCSQIKIHVTCYPRVNPAGPPLTKTCKDCDCTCDQLQIRYEEIGDCPAQYAVTFWDETNECFHEVTFDCAGGEQRVSVCLERGDDGCCYWRVTISKGYIFSTCTSLAACQNTKLYKTTCPEIDLEIHVAIGVTETEGSVTAEEIALLNIKCNPCGVFFEGARCCCPQTSTVPPVTQLLAIIDAPSCPLIDGKEIILNYTHGTGCGSYVGGGSIGECAIDTQIGLTLTCYGTSILDFVLTFTPSSSGCDPSTRCAAIIDMESSRCTPMYLRFCGFILRDNAFVTNECNCCPTGFCIIITEVP